MCYLCLKSNPFNFDSINYTDLAKKKRRASEVKRILNSLETMDVCSSGKEEVIKLKEEQYQLSRDI